MPLRVGFRGGNVEGGNRSAPAGPAAPTGPTALGLTGLGLAFLGLTAPLVTRPFDAVISHWDADIDHSLWVQWWFARSVTSEPASLFRTDRIDFPHEVSLQLADLNLAVNALAYPWLQAFGVAAAHNALLLLSFLASGWLMAVLARRLGASPALAWPCGLLFAGSPYWTAAAINGWAYLVHVWVLPLVVLASPATVAQATPRRFAALGLALALAFHVTPYYFLYASVLLCMLATGRAPAFWGFVAGHRRAALHCAAAAALPVVLLVAPRAFEMMEAARHALDVHHGPQNTALAASVAGLFLPLGDEVALRAASIGYVVPFLGWTLLAGVAAGWWAAPRPERMRALPWLLCAGVAALLALGPRLALTPDWTTDLPLPARWVQQLPGFALTTNHWRWTLPAGFALIAAFAILGGALAGRLRAQRPTAVRELAVLVLAAYALEVLLVWPLPLRKPLWEAQPSPIAWQLRARDDVRVVVDRTSRPKLNQTVHEKALALGWLPRLERSVRLANERLVAECRGLEPGCLARHGIDAVVLGDEHALLIRNGPDGASVEELRAR